MPSKRRPGIDNFEVHVVEKDTGLIHSTWIFRERDIKSLMKDRNKGNWSAVRAGCDMQNLFYAQWVPVDTPVTCLHCAMDPA